MQSKDEVQPQGEQKYGPLPLRLWGTLQSRGHAIEICGPETGHSVRAIAYCDDEQRAADIVRVCLAQEGLKESLWDMLDEFAHDADKIDGTQTTGRKHVIDRARAALAAAEGE